MKKLLLPGFLSAIAIFAASMLADFVFNAIFPDIKELYANQAIFRPWNDPLMYIYFCYPLLLGYILAWAWTWAKDTIPGSLLSKTVKFALVYWLMASLPGMLMTYSSFQLPLVMIVCWTTTAFLQAFAAALVYAKMLK